MFCFNQPRLMVDKAWVTSEFAAAPIRFASPWLLREGNRTPRELLFGTTKLRRPRLLVVGSQHQVPPGHIAGNTSQVWITCHASVRSATGSLSDAELLTLPQRPAPYPAFDGHCGKAPQST